MQLTNTFKSPIVLGGGAILGVILLLRSSNANAQVSSTMDATNPVVMSSAVAMNSAAMGANIELAKIQAQLGAIGFQADVSKQANFLSYMKALDEHRTTLETQRVISQAGITNNLITSNTAIIVDQANNANRLALAYQETDRAQIAADKDIAVARYQYKAAKAVSKNNLIGTIAGSISNIATGAMQFGVI